MQYLFEYSDTLLSPYEAFLYDTSFMPFPIRAHWHYFMEMIYMVDGTGLIDCNGQTYVIEPGDLILFPPETVHAIYTATNFDLKYEVIKFDISRLYTENSYAPELKMVLESINKNPCVELCFKEEQIRSWNVRRVFERCREEITDKKYGYDIALHSLISLLLVQVVRTWCEQGFNMDHAKALNLETDSIRGITSYIDAHIGEQIKVEDLADMCNMSYSYFAKNFKQYYGRSCKEYIEFIRISKVEDLLLFTDFDLSYISQETGFSDSSHLIKIFRKWRGMTPKQFKKNHSVAESSRQKSI